MLEGYALVAGPLIERMLIGTLGTLSTFHRCPHSEDKMRLYAACAAGEQEARSADD